MYDEINTALHSTTSANYNVVMGDFDAKVGVQKRNELKIRLYWFRTSEQQGANTTQLPSNAEALCNEFVLQEEAPEEMNLAQPRCCNKARDRFYYDE